MWCREGKSEDFRSWLLISNALWFPQCSSTNAEWCVGMCGQNLRIPHQLLYWLRIFGMPKILPLLCKVSPCTCRDFAQPIRCRILQWLSGRDSQQFWQVASSCEKYSEAECKRRQESDSNLSQNACPRKYSFSEWTILDHEWWRLLIDSSSKTAQWSPQWRAQRRASKLPPTIRRKCLIQENCGINTVEHFCCWPLLRQQRAVHNNATAILAQRCWTATIRFAANHQPLELSERYRCSWTKITECSWTFGFPFRISKFLWTMPESNGRPEHRWDYLSGDFLHYSDSPLMICTPFNQ